MNYETMKKQKKKQKPKNPQTSCLVHTTQVWNNSSGTLKAKGQYFSYRWIIVLYSHKALSISHILLDNFSLFTKGAQYFSYRCVFFLYSQKALSISHIGGFFFLYSQKALSISHIVGYFFFILKRGSVFLISVCIFSLFSKGALFLIAVGNISLFSKGAQYFSYIVG